MPTSKAQQRAVNKYVANNYDRVLVTMPKGEKDKIRSHAESRGESVNGFIGRAISETMERDKAPQRPQEAQTAVQGNTQAQQAAQEQPTGATEGISAKTARAEPIPLYPRLGTVTSRTSMPCWNMPGR